jgi:hypothetical protein
MTDSLALTKPDATMDEPTLRVMMAAADRYVKSGLLPQAIKTPQAALVIMTAGRELGVPATYALRNIYVVNGKPVCSAELLMALVRRTYGQGAIRVKSATDQACTVEYREVGWDGTSTLTFTLDDARRANLLTKDTWKQYPRAMLRNRCVSEVVRMAFPECIAGLYTPEEMGANVVVHEDDSVTIAEAVGAPTGPIEVIDGEIVLPDTAATAGPPAEQLPDDFEHNDPEARRWRLETRCQQLADYAVAIKHEKAADIRGVPVAKLSGNGLKEWVRKLEEMFDCVSASATDEPVAGAA